MLSYRQACESLGIDPGQPAPATTPISREWQPREPDALPSGQWQARAKAFLKYSQGQLERNQAAQDWLHTERGLTAETIKSAQLGFNQNDIYDDRGKWGLPDALNQNGKTRKVWLPKGLVIPLCPGDQIIRLRIRRTVADSFGRYIVVSGSSNRPMTFSQDHPGVAIVESELDAILLHQEACDLVGVIAMGSAQAKPDSDLHSRLLQAKTLLCSLDADDAGAKASVFWRRYISFKRWPSVKGKDPNEQRLAGLPVRSWIMAAL